MRPGGSLAATRPWFPIGGGDRPGINLPGSLEHRSGPRLPHENPQDPTGNPRNERLAPIGVQLLRGRSVMPLESRNTNMRAPGPERLQAAIDLVVARLEPDQIILFGSAARGQMSETATSIFW